MSCDFSFHFLLFSFAVVHFLSVASFLLSDSSSQLCALFPPLSHRLFLPLVCSFPSFNFLPFLLSLFFQLSLCLLALSPSFVPSLDSSFVPTSAPSPSVHLSVLSCLCSLVLPALPLPSGLPPSFLSCLFHSCLLPVLFFFFFLITSGPYFPSVCSSSFISVHLY